jgi:hypothetical protein
MRRIVFSIAFFRKKSPVQSTPISTKSRWKFYTQVGHPRFYTAWTRSGHCQLRLDSLHQESPGGVPVASHQVCNGCFASRAIAGPRSSVTAGSRAKCGIVMALHFYGIHCKGSHGESRYIAVAPRSPIIVTADVAQCYRIILAVCVFIQLNRFRERILFTRISACRSTSAYVGGGRSSFSSTRY